METRFIVGVDVESKPVYVGFDSTRRCLVIQTLLRLGDYDSDSASWCGAKL